jgi:hypothetical protein
MNAEYGPKIAALREKIAAIRKLEAIYASEN